MTIRNYLALTILLMIARSPMAHAGDPTGACCFCGGCEIVTQADCIRMDGAYQGDGEECTSFCSDEIFMPDPALRAALRNAIGDCLLTEFNMRKLVHLDAEWYLVADLTGLEYAVNLTDLGLQYGHISDISPLAELTNLTILNLGGNRINDISPLAGLTNLTDLSLWVNQIRDLSPITGLTRLADLQLDNNCLNFESHCIDIPSIIENNPDVQVSADYADCTNKCWPDLDGDGAVDFTDLTSVFEHWGTCKRDGDANWDSHVDFADILAVLSSWGTCERATR